MVPAGEKVKPSELFCALCHLTGLTFWFVSMFSIKFETVNVSTPVASAQFAYEDVLSRF